MNDAVQDAKPQSGTAAELAQLFPAPRVVPVRVRRVTGDGPSRVTQWESLEVRVEPLIVEDLGRFAEALLALGGLAAAALNPVALMAGKPKELAAVIAAAIDWPVERIGRLDAASLVQLAGAIFEVNQDFFGQLH